MDASYPSECAVPARMDSVVPPPRPRMLGGDRGILVGAPVVGMVFLLSACDGISSTPPPALPPLPPPPEPPEAPTGVRASDRGQDFVEWTWNPAEGATGYEGEAFLESSPNQVTRILTRQPTYRWEGLPADKIASIFLRSVRDTVGGRAYSPWVGRFSVSTLPLPPQDCSDLLNVEFLDRNDAAGTARGRLSLAAWDGYGATLDFVRPYTILIPDGGENLDVPGLFPTTGTFVSDLRFAQEDGRFRQTAVLEWVADLEIRATAAGCDSVVVSCDMFGCEKLDSGS